MSGNQQHDVPGVLSVPKRVSSCQPADGGGADQNRPEDRFDSTSPHWHL